MVGDVLSVQESRLVENDGNRSRHMELNTLRNLSTVPRLPLCLGFHCAQATPPGDLKRSLAQVERKQRYAPMRAVLQLFFTSTGMGGIRGDVVAQSREK